MEVVILPKRKSLVTEYRYYRLPQQLPILLLSGEICYISDVKIEDLHFHNCLEIGICLSECGHLKFENQLFEFQKGDITVIPPNIAHIIYSGKGIKSLWKYIYIDTDELYSKITYDSDLIAELSLLNNLDGPCIIHCNEFPIVHAIILAVVEELETKPLLFKHSVTSLLFSLFLEIYRLQREKKGSNHKTISEYNSEIALNRRIAITPALQYIDNNYMNLITISDLADICKLSQSHFRRSFQKIVGRAPIDYINGVRVKKSCALLISTEESMAYISESVGFGSISSFNRCFSKIMGVAPREWRRQDMENKRKVARETIIRIDA